MSLVPETSPPHRRPELSREWLYLLSGSLGSVQDNPVEGTYNSAVSLVELLLPVINTASGNKNFSNVKLYKQSICHLVLSQTLWKQLEQGGVEKVKKIFSTPYRLT